MLDLNDYTGKIAFANRIREARENAGLTQEGLATLMECERTTVNQWENAKNFPKLGTLSKLCNILGVDVGYLFELYPEDNSEIRTSCAITGLSQESVKQLIKLQTYPEGKARLKIIDKLLSNKRFTIVLTDSILNFINKFLYYNAAKRRLSGDVKKLRRSHDILKQLEMEDRRDSASLIDNHVLAEREASMQYQRGRSQNVYNEILEDFAKEYSNK